MSASYALNETPASDDDDDAPMAESLRSSSHRVNDPDVDLSSQQNPNLTASFKLPELSQTHKAIQKPSQQRLALSSSSCSLKALSDRVTVHEKSAYTHRSHRRDDATHMDVDQDGNDQTTAVDGHGPEKDIELNPDGYDELDYRRSNANALSQLERLRSVSAADSAGSKRRGSAYKMPWISSHSLQNLQLRCRRAQVWLARPWALASGRRRRSARAPAARARV